MKNIKKAKLGILGLGTVGSELVSLVQKNFENIKLETGIELVIEKIFVKSKTKKRKIDTTKLAITQNIYELINNDNVDIICECIGGNGCEQTKKYILEAMKNGKHVIMSSKKALANYAELFLKTAQEKKVCLKYDASVGGGIPIAKVMESAFKGERIVKIMGIFNATSNFIYSKMMNENLTYQEALLLAQEKGYAENDPSEDVDGIDSLNKLAILALFGMHKIIKPSYLTPESFSKIDIKDMKYANELGYHIKPIALLKDNIDCYNYKIGPFLIPSEHILANTFNNFNTILIV